MAVPIYQSFSVKRRGKMKKLLVLLLGALLVLGTVTPSFAMNKSELSQRLAERTN